MSDYIFVTWPGFVRPRDNGVPLVRGVARAAAGGRAARAAHRLARQRAPRAGRLRAPLPAQGHLLGAQDAAG